MQRSDIPRKTLKMISYFIKVMHYTQQGFNISPYAYILFTIYIKVIKNNAQYKTFLKILSKIYKQRVCKMYFNLSIAKVK